MRIPKESRQDVAYIVLLCAGLLAAFFWHPALRVLGAIAFAAIIPTFVEAGRATWQRRISIDTFNVFAVSISFLTGEFRSAAFIALMLTFARLLETHTATRASHAVTQLLKLKPLTAYKENASGKVIEVPVESIEVNDVILVRTGGRIPVDGTIVFGEGYLNEASVTGESVPVKKHIGKQVISGTLLTSGTLKIQAKRVGTDTTIERMAALMRDASKNKSRSEKLADRFATIFLPLVALTGLITYLITHNLAMTSSLFLVACADEMAVSIPLAITASLGRAANRGVIVKGGEWLHNLAQVDTIILDKTGTLTYGEPTLLKAPPFLRLLAIAEKFSEHPVSHAILAAAQKKYKHIPDPDHITTYKGEGIRATFKKHDIIAGNQKIVATCGLHLSASASAEYQKIQETSGQTPMLVFIDGEYRGIVTVADTPRPEAKKSIHALNTLGIDNITMYTGDNPGIAEELCGTLGIDHYVANMSPEKKLLGLEALLKKGHHVAMIGDGINDAPALARASVGIAMGKAGSAVASEAADVIILNDNLLRIPEMIDLGRRTDSVIRLNMVLWFISNTVGFLLVFTGLFTPALAAFYNFATDFLPLINSSRLFRKQ